MDALATGRWIGATNDLLQTWMRPSMDPRMPKRTPTDVRTPSSPRDAAYVARHRSLPRTERLHACGASLVLTHRSMSQSFDVGTTDPRHSHVAMLRWLPFVLSTVHEGTTLPRQFPRCGIELTCTQPDFLLGFSPSTDPNKMGPPQQPPRQVKATNHRTNER